MRNSGHIVQSCVDMLAQSYNDPHGLFEEGLHTWEWFIQAQMKRSYNEKEKAKHKEALKQRPVPFFGDLDLSVEKGDRVLIIYGLS